MGAKQSSALSFEDLSNVTVENDVDLKNITDEIAALFRFKILLLGTGESGKSTILKQLKVLHKKKLTAREYKLAGDGIHQSIISCMQQLCMARRSFGVYELGEEEKKTEFDVEQWVDAGNDNDEARIAPEFGARIKRLFESEAIQKTFARRSEFWILDGCAWYMANVERVCADDWQPTEEDVMMARVRTTGIIVTDLEEKQANVALEMKIAPGAAGPAPAASPDAAAADNGNEKSVELVTPKAAATAAPVAMPERITWQIVDVGGQRNERKKWIHCFDDVKGVLFVDNLAGYNSVMFEDNTKNRMHESLELWHKISFLKPFARTPFFLLLNKRDLFEQMIKEVDLKHTFPEYSGGRDYRNAIEFVQNAFTKQMPPKKVAHIEAISARFSREVRLAFDQVKEQVYGKNKDELITRYNELLQLKAQRIAVIEHSKKTGCCIGAPPTVPLPVASA